MQPTATEWLVQPVQFGPRALSALHKLYKMTVVPCIQASCSVVLDWTTPGVANALRRAILESVPHACLAYETPITPFSATTPNDPYMTDGFVRRRLACVPLCVPLPADLDEMRFSLNVENGSSTAGGEIVTVHTGDLQRRGGAAALLFNPHIELATVSPACCLRINDIRCVRGTGRAGPEYHVATNVCTIALDLPRWPKEETHNMRSDKHANWGKHQYDCDFSVDVLTTIAHAHRLMFVASAVPASDPVSGVRAILCLACDGLVNRLTLMLKAIGLTATSAETAVFEIIPTEDNAGLRVRAPGETDTLMSLVVDVIHNLYPDIQMASSLILGPVPELVVCASDPRAVLQRAIEEARTIFANLRVQFSNITPTLVPPTAPNIRSAEERAKYTPPAPVVTKAAASKKPAKK